MITRSLMQNGYGYGVDDGDIGILLSKDVALTLVGGEKVIRRKGEADGELISAIFPRVENTTTMKIIFSIVGSRAANARETLLNWRAVGSFGRLVQVDTASAGNPTNTAASGNIAFASRKSIAKTANERRFIEKGILLETRTIRKLALKL